MVAFGGAGGLFATEVADFLGITTIISPPDPGNLCAFGLHVSDVRRDYIRTIVRRQSAADGGEIVAGVDGAGAKAARRHHARRASPTEENRDPSTSPTSAISARVTRCRSTFRPNSADEAADRPTCGRSSTRSTTAPSASTTRASRTSSWSICASRRWAAQHRPSLSAATRPSDSRRSHSRRGKVYWREPAGSNARSTGGRRSPRAGDRGAGDHRGIRLDRRGAAGSGPAPSDAYGNLILESQSRRRSR